ncbi:hypothetical protein RRG08_054220 [Elysia crispata]|uniref:Uncharacterized protein n=1 Tax=Elysia crispata TaxID=231223 RepID=A0AAE0YBR5_9GAST|nr:hypothetical protein RRG08_054220 [Elysia crispata]
MVEEVKVAGVTPTHFRFLEDPAILPGPSDSRPGQNATVIKNLKSATRIKNRMNQKSPPRNNASLVIRIEASSKVHLAQFCATMTGN